MKHNLVTLFLVLSFLFLGNVFCGHSAFADFIDLDGNKVDFSVMPDTGEDTGESPEEMNPVSESVVITEEYTRLPELKITYEILSKPEYKIIENIVSAAGASRVEIRDAAEEPKIPTICTLSDDERLGYVQSAIDRLEDAIREHIGTVQSIDAIGRLDDSGGPEVYVNITNEKGDKFYIDFLGDEICNIRDITNGEDILTTGGETAVIQLLDPKIIEEAAKDIQIPPTY